MARSSFDAFVRGTAAAAAIAAVMIVTANPQIATNFDARAKNPAASQNQQRQADGKAKGYSYLLKPGDHRYPARWCGGVIPYSLDLTVVAGAGMDPAAEAVRWGEVLQRWSQASGGYYRFTYAGPRTLGTGEDGQLDIDSIEPGTIGITFVHGEAGSADATHQASAVRGRTAGNGGLQVVTNGTVEGGALVGDRGFVMIDVDDAAALSPDGLRRTLYQHESGHALGLGHVDDQQSIMNGTLSSARLDIASGDIAGITSLTRMPCEH